MSRSHPKSWFSIDYSTEPANVVVEAPVGSSRKPCSRDFSSADYRFKHIPALDGFRGVAALIVVCYHTKVFPHFIGSGQSAMEMFFVLSGFLITSILRRERTDSGRILIRRFYIRRFRRLFPALCCYSLTVIGVGAVTRWWAQEEILMNAAASITYTSNWIQLSLSEVPIVFGQTWSLAIEEQYYLVWPFVVLALSLLVPSRRLSVIMILFGAALTIRLVMSGNDLGLPRLRNGTDVRALGLVAGSALALLLEQGYASVERMLGTRKVAWVAASGLVLTWFAPATYTERLFITWLIVAILASAALVGHVAVCNAQNLSSPFNGFLRTRCLVFLGGISYSLYLWHPLAIDAARRWGIGTSGRPLQFTVMLGVSLVFAVISYVTVERRFRSPR